MKMMRVERTAAPLVESSDLSTLNSQLSTLPAASAYEQARAAFEKAGVKLMPPLLQIVDWQRFEALGSSGLFRDETWKNVLGQSDGAAVYGIWALLIELCKEQPVPRDGWLTTDGTREGERFTVKMLAQRFWRPRAEIARMLQVATADDVGWIAVVDGDRVGFRTMVLPLEGIE